ncbi:hypothetical protein F4775DRAFT_592564 [Biscogniauxia sp. FL1348]|nr:hypothetical protein F4775DRAFT_592564 [Biscogniauxia sp. FL1348]
MASVLHHQIQVEAPPPLAQEAPSRNPGMSPCSNLVTPSKRSDDDIQFISSNPVKRRKISGQKIKNHGHPELILPSGLPVPVTPAYIPPTEVGEAERRVSTGMVGLPSDINAMELTCALRGVSLPVLENFVLDQPLRRPRPVSSPELSPKQLPHTKLPPTSGAHIDQTGPEPGPEPQAFDFQAMANHAACCLPTAETPAKQGALPHSHPTGPNGNQVHVLNTPINQPADSPTLGSTGHTKVTDMKNTAMLPPPLPKPEVSPAPESNAHDACRPNTSKQPCQMCSRMRQQANITRAQGLPMMNSSVPHHLIPHMPYPPPYSQHFHPHMMPMAPNHMHPFGPGFAPFMMPVNGNTFAALPSQFHTSVQHGGHQNPGPGSQPVPENTNDTTQPAAVPSPPPATSGAAAAKPGKPGSPVKPPASLIQPTYRKHSPNLIVDVAETCQEKFPFEEVAKRHNAPVEKVFDIFAAIIQVPLLRCPTDRRRAGRLATARVKEYTKAKKDMQESRAQGSDKPSGNRGKCAVDPSDVAHRLGQVDFPEGFHLGG